MFYILQDRRLSLGEGFWLDSGFLGYDCSWVGSNRTLGWWLAWDMRIKVKG